MGHMSSKSSDVANSWNSPELRLARSLFVAFTVFLICWSPYAVVVLVDIHDTWPKVSHKEIYASGPKVVPIDKGGTQG